MFTGMQAGGCYRLVQDHGKAQPWIPPRTRIELRPAEIRLTEVPTSVSIASTTRIPVPRLTYHSLEGAEVPILDDSGRATLLLLWASWCQPCLAELDEPTRHQSLYQNHVRPIAVSVDLLDEFSAGEPEVRAVLEKTRFPYEGGFATEFRLAGEIEDRLKLFKHRQPYRKTPVSEL